MNLTTLFHTWPMAVLLTVCSAGWTPKSYRYEALPVDLRLQVTEKGNEVSGYSAFRLPGHFTWGASVTRADDGKYYMIYSASEDGVYPFTDAWVLGSKMGLAVSDRPDGGFRHLGFFLNADGFAPDTTAWDAQTVCNPHVRRFNGRYYLYYAGSADPADLTPQELRLPKRARVQQSQCIGVIVFDRFTDLLKGRFSRSEQPLLRPRTRVKSGGVLRPSPAGTRALPDNLIAVNPSVVYRPSDGKYLLYFKGNLYDPHWRGVHGVAIADRPEGPFRPLDRPVFTLKGTDGKLSAEDPYVWYHPKDECFYAVFKDFGGQFTKGVPSLAVMASKDGIDWQLPQHSLFLPKQLTLTDGSVLKVDRLERPQLLIDDDGSPQVLYAACSVGNLNPSKFGESFNVQIPIRTRPVAEP